MSHDKMAEQPDTSLAYDVVVIDQGSVLEGELALRCDMFLRILTGEFEGTLYTYNQEDFWPNATPVRQGVAFEIFWNQVNGEKT